MSTEDTHITVCICTFRRLDLLQSLLERLGRQHTNGAFTFSIAVADNDAQRSAEQVVADFSASSRIAVSYVCEARQNIALARNAVLRLASGSHIACIDDDELPGDDWLAHMLRVCESYDCAGVLGPVRPHFNHAPPDWILDGKFFERPEYPTGRIMPWEECRTGNLLFRHSIVQDETEPFKPEFGTGGEDKDFFQRMSAVGHLFRWCNEAPVYETVPEERCTRNYLLRRAMLRGRNVLKLRVGKARLLAKSAVAAPVYLVALPFALCLGQHVFMKYSIRFCDHAGRILTLLGLNPVHER